MNEDEAPVVDEQKVDTTWDDDAYGGDFEIPYSREEVEQSEEEGEVEEAEEDNDVPTAPVMEEIVTVEDPGEFVPEDLSFQYEIDGKKYTISSSDDIDSIPDEDLEKLSASKITKLLRDAAKVDMKREKAQEEHAAKVEKYQEQVKQQQEYEQQVISIANEFDYLVGKGLIPAVPDKLRNADWSDPKISSQEGVKQQKEILDYMSKENAIRLKAGIKPITSAVDAFNALQQENRGKEDAKRDTQVKQARKAAGARVAGGTNNNSYPPIPKGIAVGRTNAFDNNTIWED